MNKIYNTWIFIISIVSLPLAFFIGINEVYGVFGMEIYFQDFQYGDLVLGIAALLIFMLGFRRSLKKWNGLRIANQKEKYIWNHTVGKERKKRVLTYNLIEVVYFFVLAIVFVSFALEAAIVSLVFFVFIIDSLVNTCVGVWGKKYRVGITRKAIVAVDREVIAIYFKGLNKVSIVENIMYFEYVNDLVLDLSMEHIEKEKQQEFIATLTQQLDPEKVYFSGIV